MRDFRTEFREKTCWHVCAQAQRYGAGIRAGRVDRLAQANGCFIAATEAGALHAQMVLLATGVVNRWPSMINDTDHARALAGGQEARTRSLIQFP
jgi:thioredoxin reductase (NADPH)